MRTDNSLIVQRLAVRVAYALAARIIKVGDPAAVYKNRVLWRTVNIAQSKERVMLIGQIVAFLSSAKVMSVEKRLGQRLRILRKENTLAKWVISDVGGITDEAIIHVRHVGPRGKAAVAITGDCVPGFMGDTLALMQAALAIPVENEAPTLIDWMSFSELGRTMQSMDYRMDDIYQRLISDEDKNPTGKVDGALIENVRAHY